MLGRQATFLVRRPLHVRLAAVNTQSKCVRSIQTSSPIYGAGLSKPGRPKKAVGEPSRVIKRAVKRVAKKPAADETDAASRSVAEKQAKATTKAKPKAAAKPQVKAAKKAKPAKRVMTEAQAAAKKEKAAHAKATKDLKSLKEAALTPPKVIPSNAYLQFAIAKRSGLKDLLASAKEKHPGDGTYGRPVIAQHAKALGVEWKQQTAADLEHWNHLAHTSKETALAAYKSWVQSHTPEQIRLANSARRTLRRRESLSKKGSHTRWPPIVDEREPKAAVQPYIQFTISRNASGDFKNIGVVERARLIGAEWKALGEGEKEKYKSLHSADRERYIDEYSSVHGHAPLNHLQSQHPELTHAAAAA